MYQIEICVEKKTAVKTKGISYVCGNSDYAIVFSFDAEWNAFYEKTARFHYVDEATGKRRYQDVLFQGNMCPVPVFIDVRVIRVGVFAGNLHTTTNAVIAAKRSALCDSGSPAAPTEDVYAQIMERLNNIEANGAYDVGHGLKVVNNKLTVDSVSDFKGDNTLPASAALVQTTVGNIEQLLSTI